MSSAHRIGAVLLAAASCGGPPAGPQAALDAEVAATRAALAPSNPCTSPEVTGVKVALPAGGGAYHGFFVGRSPVREADITDFEQRAGKRVAWVYLQNNWGSGGRLDLRFPTTDVQTIWSHGAVPFLRFAPWTSLVEYQADPVVRMKDIVDTTRFDAALRTWLLAAKAARIPIIVQFGVEVNGYWFPWNGYWNGRGTRTWRDPTWPDGPEAYRLAYRKIIDMARQNDVWNITWAFHVSHWPEPAEASSSWNRMRYYYPGDSYIDWIGISVYGEMFPYGEPIQWNPLTDLLGTNNPEIAGGLSPYQELVALTPSATKPMALFETAVVEDPAAGSKPDWIRDALAAVASPRFARIRGFNWWNERWDNDPPLGPSDMRINSSAATQQAYRAAVGAAYYKGAPTFLCTKSALP